VNDDPYREFDEALTDVLTETAYNLSRRTRLANARAAVARRAPRPTNTADHAASLPLPRTALITSTNGLPPTIAALIDAPKSGFVPIRWQIPAWAGARLQTLEVV